MKILLALALIHDGERKRVLLNQYFVEGQENKDIYNYEKEKTSCKKTKYIKTKNETEIVPCKCTDTVYKTFKATRATRSAIIVFFFPFLEGHN